MAASRLHLPIPPQSPITHVYHNADPIPQGACTGVGSLCAEAGYALETGCHLGQKIVYDTVNEYGWKVDVKKHVIKEVINKVLEDEREWEPGREVPKPVEEDEDCIVSLYSSRFDHAIYVGDITRIVISGRLGTSRKTKARMLYINL